MKKSWPIHEAHLEIITRTRQIELTHQRERTRNRIENIERLCIAFLLFFLFLSTINHLGTTTTYNLSVRKHIPSFIKLNYIPLYLLALLSSLIFIKYLYQIDTNVIWLTILHPYLELKRTK